MGTLDPHRSSIIHAEFEMITTVLVLMSYSRTNAIKMEAYNLGISAESDESSWCKYQPPKPSKGDRESKLLGAGEIGARMFFSVNWPT